MWSGDWSTSPLADGRAAGGVELQGRIAAGSQMLADEQADEEQRQHAEDPEAAEVPESGEAGLGEIGHVGVGDSGAANRRRFESPGGVIPFIVMKRG